MIFTCVTRIGKVAVEILGPDARVCDELSVEEVDTFIVDLRIQQAIAARILALPLPIAMHKGGSA